ncbi:DNA translocase FtsK [Magnetospirillum gryphiswaldense]|uniref:DNA translocase n=1 Tax=Magnetospirillum gryphiswaldense TaxID=55518 RepID=A4TYM5_9PROT|nr:DNA translocase FtsK [Magnetospirillum gryphiswaldense]AVM74669.1 DNA translocase FtsK [Magnetospirillum gryphiswaldense MSR-1]AVM78572.1 DNA translocase FtsK [Magnetospirillum gryphiswaldense]CAM75732.1 DNA translocase [Magnetospirillum gryphiswaldense MSR-1]
MTKTAEDSMSAADFNFWCAVNSKPFRLVRHTWDDGETEWDIEVFPGRPEATTAYGTGQTDEKLAAIAAFAFIAGVEWGECFARDQDVPQDELSLTAPDLPLDDEDDEEEDGDVDEPPVSALPVVVAPRGAGPYRLPAVDLLQAPPPRTEAVDDEESLAVNARALETVLRNFKVRGEIMEVHQGPVVTLYEFEPLPGTKSSTVINLADDIARSMRSITTRIAIVPGRSVIGIELPNPVREKVFFREILESKAFTEFSGHLPLALGKDIAGEAVVADLARMPHLLIAGTTGSGKSVGVNSMILSLLYRFKPEECRLILVDPKMLELSIYDGIPHLLTPVVTAPDKAVRTLKWAVREMETRYRAMSLLGVRNIEGFNARLLELARTGQKMTHRIQVGFDKGTREPVYEEQPIDLRRLPHIVIVVDEMADLMMVAGRELEAAIQRLAQMARAAGIHLIMATQRPSVDVITGTIKANFPTRISFQVTSRIDSRTILGESGAEQLVGQGDMLYMAAGGRITRVHGPFVSDAEVEQVVNHLKAQGEPEYLDSITDDDEAEMEGGGADSDGGGFTTGDDLYDQAVALVLRERKVSISFVQRHLQVGYNRSARLVERMEDEGIVTPANHQGKREVLGRRGGDFD